MFNAENIGILTLNMVISYGHVGLVFRHYVGHMVKPCFSLLNGGVSCNCAVFPIPTCPMSNRQMISTFFPTGWLFQVME